MRAASAPNATPNKPIGTIRNIVVGEHAKGEYFKPADQVTQQSDDQEAPDVRILVDRQRRRRRGGGVGRSIGQVVQGWAPAQRASRRYLSRSCDRKPHQRSGGKLHRGRQPTRRLPLCGHRGIADPPFRDAKRRVEQVGYR